MRLSPFLVLALSICLVSARADAAAFKITVPAAGMERAGIVLSFPLPSAAPATATLRDAHGTSIPLQIGADREGQFVIAALHAGVSPVFTLATPSAAPVAAITTRSSFPACRWRALAQFLAHAGAFPAGGNRIQVCPLRLHQPADDSRRSVDHRQLPDRSPAPLWDLVGLDPNTVSGSDAGFLECRPALGPR